MTNAAIADSPHISIFIYFVAFGAFTIVVSAIQQWNHISPAIYLRFRKCFLSMPANHFYLLLFDINKWIATLLLIAVA